MTVAVKFAPTMLSNRIFSKNRLILNSAKLCIRLCWRRNVSQTTNHVQSAAESPVTANPAAADVVFEFHNNWPAAIKTDFLRDMTLYEDFISVSEEQELMTEVDQVTKRMRYEYDHWDDAIHGYRETERKGWYPHNRLVLDRLGKFSFDTAVMPYVHVLDLAKDGIIKPHVDSSRYCGNIIAGLSLLTDCIMRLRRVDETKYYQGNNSDQIHVKPDAEATKEFDYYVDILLKRRSLYIMRDSARYKFTHEVLAPGALFKQQPVDKDRRVSIICRNDS